MWRQQLKNIKQQRFSKGIKYLVDFTKRIDKANSADMVNFRQNMPQFMSIIFGDNNSKGWMIQCYQDVIKQQSPEAFSKLDMLSDYLSPKNQGFYNLVFNYSHSNCLLDFLYLPEYLKKQMDTWKNNKIPSHSLQMFCKIFDNNQNFSKSNQISVSIAEWYLIVFITKLKQFISHSRNLKGIELFMIDEFYYDFTRNPLLIVVRRYLKHFSQFQKKYQQKFISFIRQYLIKDYIKLAKGKQSPRYYKTIQIPKSQILQTIYFSIHYSGSKLKSQQMYNYFHIIAQNWTGMSHTTNICDVIRVWLMYTGIQQYYEDQLIKTLDLNQRKKFSERIRSVQKQIYIDDNQDKNGQDYRSSQFSTTLLHLLMIALSDEKSEFTFRHLHTLNLVCKILKLNKKPGQKVIGERFRANAGLYEQAQNQSKKLIIKSQSLSQNFKNKLDLTKISPMQLGEIQKKIIHYNQNIKSSICFLYQLPQDMQFDVKYITSNQNNTKLLIKHVPVKFNNQWEAPIASNESSIFYYIFFVIAKLIDIILGRSVNGYPRTNLRKMITHTNLLIMTLGILCIVLIVNRE